MVPGSPTRLFALMLLAALAICGCAHPLYIHRDHVSSELTNRIGHDLGPSSAAGDISVPESIEWDDGLTEDEAITLGLWNNPAYQELLADLDISAADLTEANQLRNPQLTAMFPLSAKQWELTLLLPLDVIALRPHRVCIAQLESQRVAERLVQDGLNVVRDVRWAYVDLAAAQQRVSLIEDSERLQQQIVEIAEARLKAGAVSDLDVAPIRLETLFIHDEVMRAQEEVSVARSRLRFLLGAATASGDISTADLSAGCVESLDVEDLVTHAIALRPDLQAIQLGVNAAQERARLSRYDYFNIQGALPDINGDGAKGVEAGPGLQLVLPILNQNQGATERAGAEVERLERQYIRMRDSAAMEVRQAHARLERAKSSLQTMQADAVPLAKAASDSSRKALIEDGVSLLVVLESSRQLLQARQRELLAIADVRRAMAELERSVGGRLFEYSDNAEIENKSSDAPVDPSPLPPPTTSRPSIRPGTAADISSSTAP